MVLMSACLAGVAVFPVAAVARQGCGRAAETQLPHSPAMGKAGNAMARAIKAGRAEEVETWLQKGFPANQPLLLGDGWHVPIPPLALAVMEGKAAVVDVLLRNGADANAEIPDVGTPLILAAEEGDVDIMHRLLDAGAKANTVVGSLAGTPLVSAIAADVKDAMPAVRLLLDYGADVNLAGEDGMTPLMMAAAMERPDVVHALLQHGAKAGMQNAERETALMLAVQEGNDQAVRQLLSSRAYPKGKDAHGFSLMQAAARGGSPAVISQLLAAGVRVDGALEWAAAYGHLEAIEVLLKAGADVEEKNRYGYTPLMAAVVMKQPEAAQLLLSAGASVGTLTPDGLNLLQVAEANGDVAMQKLLRPLMEPAPKEPIKK